MNVRIFGQQWWVTASKGSKKALSILAISGLVLMSAPVGLGGLQIAFAAGPTILLSDDFGTGSSINDIPDWDEEGSDSSGTTNAQAAGSGNDSASPDGGRFAKIREDEWICQEIDAEGYDSLWLSYYWRGDSDAEGSDVGVVEYSTNYDDCDDADWEDSLQEHDMSIDSSWSTQSAFSLPEELNDTEFLLRFRTDSSASDEYFRVDGVLLTSDTGSISGYKLDQDENGVDGWVIWLYDSEEGEWNDTETNEDGYYTFENLVDGDYTVCEELGDGWQQAYPEDAEESGVCGDEYDTNGYDITVENGEDFEDVNFVNQELGSITITKDTTPGEIDQDFTFTTSGEGLEGFTLNTNGTYTQTFSNLSPAEYSVTEGVVDGYVLTGISCEGGDVDVNVEIGEVSFGLEYGDHVSCTYTNERLPNLNIVKYASPGDSVFQIDVAGPDEMSGTFFAEVAGTGQDSSEELFDNIQPGVYTLEENLPEGWAGVSSVSCYNGDEQIGDSGTTGAAVELGYGDNVTCIFNNTPYSTIVGDKFEDLDGNGESTSGSGIEGWDMTLYKWTEGDGWYWDDVAFDATDEGGVYSFGNVLPGSYLVCEENREDWDQSSGTGNSTACDELEGQASGGYTLTIADIPPAEGEGEYAGQTFDGFSFGNYQLGSIAGVKWDDANADGVLDGDEEGISDWQITLSGTESDDTYTAGGSYSFTNLEPGTYTVNEVQQGGWVQTYPSTGSHTVVITSGQNTLNVNFGNVEDSAISGSKWNDENGNGILDDGEESPDATFTFELYRVEGESAPVFVTSISDDSYYNFTGLLPGTYQVREADAEGWMQTSPANGGWHTVTVGVNENAEGYNFGNIEVIELYGYKFNDLDRDGQWYYEGEEDEEPGLSGWTIYATPITEEGGGEDTEGNRVAKTAVTNEEDEDTDEGAYEFEFLGNEEGWWRISEEDRFGWSQTYPGGIIEEEEDPYYYDVYISAGGDEWDCEGPGYCEGGYYNYDFGNWRWPVVEIFKWNDANRDGVHNEIVDTEELEGPVADYPVAVGRHIESEEPQEGVIDTEIVALTLTGSNGIASLPLNPDWFGGFEGLDQALRQGLMAFEGRLDGWVKTYPTQSHDDEVVLSFREGIEPTPLFLDSFFDIFTEISFEEGVTNLKGSVHGTEGELAAIAFGNTPFLVISDEIVPSVGEGSVVVEWTTDRPATSRVAYDTVSHPVLGDAPNYGYANSTNTFDTDPKVEEHKVTVGPGLTPGATYYYRSISSASPDTVGSEGSFTTNPLGVLVAAGGGGGGGGIIGGPLSVGYQTPGTGGGQVLGAATFTPAPTLTNTIPAPTGTQCVTSFLGAGRNNDSAQIQVLQTILLSEGFNVEVNGVFDGTTGEAVKGFQLKYADEILKPWGITEPTGLVYLTTRNKLNALHCSGTSGLSADEQSVIDRYKGGMSGSTTGTIRTATPDDATEIYDEEIPTKTDESQTGAVAASDEDGGFWKKLRNLLGF